MEKELFSTILSRGCEDDLVSMILCKLRYDVAEFMLSRDSEEDFFDLTPTIRKWKARPNTIKTVVKAIRDEIETTTFNTELGYGGTGLFIYKGDTPPSNCW